MLPDRVLPDRGTWIVGLPMRSAHKVSKKFRGEFKTVDRLNMFD